MHAGFMCNWQLTGMQHPQPPRLPHGINQMWALPAVMTMHAVRHAGSSKVVVQSAEVLDLTGATAATPATPPGVLFCPWNPDESYTRDALIRVQARLGTPEPMLTVYDHLDILVHPLGVHLTERVATQFWVRLPLLPASVGLQAALPHHPGWTLDCRAELEAGLISCSAQLAFGWRGDTDAEQLLLHALSRIDEDLRMRRTTSSPRRMRQPSARLQPCGQSPSLRGPLGGAASRRPHLQT